MTRRPFSAPCAVLPGVVLTLAVSTSVVARTSDDDDAKLRQAEPDFVIVNLPTTLPLPKGAGNFHLTHRFNENLRHDDLGDQFANLFGLDNGANIGLEFRYGVAKHLEAIVQRTSISKAVQLTAKYDGWHEEAAQPFGLSVLVSIEGENNFHNSNSGRANFAPSLGFVISRAAVNDRIAVYAMPFWVHSTGIGSDSGRNTGFLGLGGRVRILDTTYLIGEASPRIGGLVVLDDPLYGFGIEKRVGGHVFSLTFTNRAATTFRQMATGGTPGNLNLGFNLTRKFF